MLARQQDGDRPLEETVADTQTFEGSWNLIFRASGIIGIAFLFYQRWVQVQSGLLAHDLSTDIAALKAYPNQQVWQAPYGQLWYALNLAIPHSTGLEWTLWIALLDIPVSLLVLFKTWKLWLVYIAVSTLSFTSAPYNMPVLWLTSLGLFRRPSILLGPLTKIPDTIPQLQYVLSWSVHQIGNWWYYGLLMVWFLSVLFYTLTISIRHATRRLRERFLGGLNPHARPGGNKTSNGIS